jgi:hypothetical protein
LYVFRASILDGASRRSSTKKGLLLDGSRWSSIWRRSVSHASRPVMESRSSGIKRKRPLTTLFRSHVEDTKPMQPSSSSPPVPPRLSADKCLFCLFEDGLLPKDRMRPYSRIDSLRYHVLRVHLNQASRRNYSLQGLSLTPIRLSTIDRSLVQSAVAVS